MPEEVAYRRLVLREPRELIARDVGCTIRDVNHFCNQVSDSDRRAFSDERQRRTYQQWEAVCWGLRGSGRAQLLRDIENRLSSYQTLMRNLDELERLKVQSYIPNPLHYLAEEWSTNPTAPRRSPSEKLPWVPEGRSSLLIGLPKTKDEPDSKGPEGQEEL